MATTSVKKATTGVDPITVEVLRNAFNAVADEMNANLEYGNCIRVVH